MTDPKKLKVWKHHWQDEVDAAFLYRELAALESDPERRILYERLADVEDRHVHVWEKIFQENGVPLPPATPSLKARLQARLARRFGSGLLLRLLLIEEGAEVKKYLSLHRDSSPGSAKTAALTLAQESVRHAADLRELSNVHSEPWHKTGSGDILRNVVYGFNDGLTANFGLVAGLIGGDVSHYAVLLSGMAGTVADALSMGSSGYLAAVSQREVYEHEIAMEKEEIALMPELEAEELALIYQSKGFEESSARQLAAQIMRDPENVLREMIKEELKIGETATSPVNEGLITGLSTAVGAFIPVAPFVFWDIGAAIWISFVLSMLAHFGVGAARSLFTGRGIFRSGWDMFLVGFGVAAFSYFFGDLAVHWFTGRP